MKQERPVLAVLANRENCGERRSINTLIQTEIYRGEIDNPSANLATKFRVSNKLLFVMFPFHQSSTAPPHTLNH